jgi:hypothetical protein
MDASPPHAAAPPVLEFAGVLVDARPPYDEGVEEATFVLGPGGLAMVRPGMDDHLTPWGDAATGMTELAAGEVRFAGHAWQEMAPDRVSQERARIGRIFAERAWLNNLDLDENILLPWRYHTARKDAELLAEADALARDFGLPGVPRVRPSAAGRRELRLAGWVRAFMGAPALLVIDRPMNDAPPGALDPLVAKANERLAAGAAALWIAGSEAEWTHPGLKPALKIDRRSPMVYGQ